ncbi:MAG: RagB/SusD family nutrient uptake outer membrane protein [Chryseolinea sp.]
MKKILLFFIAGLVGCSSFLDENPQGQIVGDNAINTVKGLDAALTGAYKGWLRVWSRGFLTNGALQGTTAGGDDLTTLPVGNKEKWRELDQFDVNDQNPHIAQIWNGAYKTIQGANNVIMNSVKTQGDQSQIDQIVGEAYFLRGLSYYWLVRSFGRVPLITQSEFTEDLLTVGSSEETAIYEAIEADLAQAEVLLANAKRDPGRPNKGSAKALLADVYLTQGGWPIKNASKYALAAAKAKDVIDHKSDYGFDLVPDLTTLWPGAASSIATSEEVIAFHTSASFGGSVNAFWGDSGRPGESGGWDDYFAEITFFNNFPAGKRKDATFLTEWYNNATKSTIQWQDSKAKHPYFKKFSLVEHVWASGMPVHIMRYAHVLLIYAEAKARSGGPDAQAYEAVNKVRERAGLEPLNGLSNEAFAKAIVDERSWEFAGEWTRWYDLVRLEMVEEANSHKDVNDLKPIGVITKADYQFPIPGPEVAINPNLVSDGD